MWAKGQTGNDMDVDVETGIEQRSGDTANAADLKLEENGFYRYVYWTMKPF